MNLNKTIKLLKDHKHRIERIKSELAKAKADQAFLFTAIGQELRVMRKERRLKGVTVAKAVGISQPTLFFVEHGEAPIDENRLREIYAVVSK